MTVTSENLESRRHDCSAKRLYQDEIGCCVYEICFPASNDPFNLSPNFSLFGNFESIEESENKRCKLVTICETTEISIIEFTEDFSFIACEATLE